MPTFDNRLALDRRSSTPGVNVELLTPAATRWPLRGRRAQLRRALAALESGRGDVLVGDPGVGKTRLAQEILEGARRRGHPVRWAAGTPAARAIAFGALAHLLPAPTPAGASTLNLLQRALAALAELGADRRLVLGVDDAHLLDDASSALLHLAASSANVLVVATARADVATPEPVTALWKDGLADRIELQPLSRPEMIDLAAEILGGDLDERTGHLLWRATLGNPLYLRELLQGGLDAGHLHRSDGLWRWRGPLRTGSRLAEVVRARLGRLGPELTEVLEIVAVGQHLEVSLVERLCGERLLREAETRGLVAIVRDGRRSGVELAHPLYAEVLRQAIPQHRAERIMGRLASALEATGARRRGDLLRSCDWRLQARLPVPEEALLAGMTLARETGDWRLADRILAAVSREGASNRARVVLGDALYSVGRWEEAEAMLSGLDTRSLPADVAAEATMLRIGNLIAQLGRPYEAERIVDRLAADPAGPPPWLPCCRAQLAVARGEVARALEVLPAGAAPRPLAAAVPLALAIGHSGDAEAALALLDRTLIASGGMATYVLRREAFATRLWFAVLGGHYDEAPLERIYASAVHGEDRLGLWFAAVLAGVTTLASGDAEAARRWEAELAAIVPTIRSGTGVAFGHAVRAELLALVGETARAADALAEMEAVRWPVLDAYGELTAARCAVAAAEGDLGRARALALDAADRALRRGQAMMVVGHGLNAARCGAPGAAAERIERVASRLTGPLLPVIADHVKAWSLSDAKGLDAAGRAFSATGAYLLAAEAAVTATRLHQDAGRTAAAAISGSRAAALLERCAGCRTPALATGPRLSPLTPRELQVARLAGDLGNRDIAERLGISPRTVETHLQRAYDKLGVNDRSRLGAALGAGDGLPR